MSQILSWLAELFGVGAGHPGVAVDLVVDAGVTLINDFLDEFTMTVIIVLVGLWVVVQFTKGINRVLVGINAILERENMILEILMAFRDQTDEEGS